MKLLKLTGLQSPHQDANLKAFDAVCPGLASRIIAAQTQPHIGLAIEENGTAGAFSTVGDQIYWVNRPGQSEQEVTAFLQELISKNLLFTRDLFVLAGFGLGFPWRALISMLRRTPHCQGAVVIEPEPAWLFAAASAHDLSDFILHSDTFWVVGKDWRNQLATLCEKEFLHGFGKMIVLPGHPIYAPFQKETCEEISRGVQEILSAKRASFDADVRAFAAKRQDFRPQVPRRIWALSDRRPSYRVLYQVAEPFLEGFEKIGLEVLRGIREGTRYYPPLLSLRQFIDSDADSFFSINSPFDEVMGHPFSSAIQAIKMVWYVDHPYFWCEFSPNPWDPPNADLFAERLRGHHLFLYDASDRFFFLDHGITPAGYLPHSGIFLEDNIPENPEFSCDVSFVGSLYFLPGFFGNIPQTETNTIMQYVYAMGEIVFREGLIPPEFDGLFERNPPPPQVLEIERRGIMTRLRLTKLIYLDADNRFRLACVKALASFDFRLIGDAYWLEHLGNHPVRKAWKNRISFEQLPSFYKSCKINVNLNSRQLKTAHSNRTFNTVGLGRLTLSNYFEGMEHIFPRGVGIDYFSTPDQLQERVQYYLDHPDEREECARRGRAVVLAEHKPEDRARMLVDVVTERIRHGESVYRSFRDWHPPNYQRIEPSPERLE
ncbi:MAG TPA: glycosyltransferase [bacterium]|nr:glycosyltransferase [bacterium]HQP98286.1 glycosyltransferase [bacterium]